MIQRNFPAASVQGDWAMPITLDLSKLTTTMTDDEVVEFHMAPDGVTGWDDYGLRRLDSRPAYRAGWHSFEANSNDGTNVVTILPGPLARVIVPARVMSSMGPAMVSIGAHFVRLSTGQRVTLLSGRLPIVAVP